MVEQLKDDARVDWRQNGLSVSQSACAVGHASVLPYPYDLRSVSYRIGGAWNGRVDKSNATQKRQGQEDRRAGWRAQPRARDRCGVLDWGTGDRGGGVAAVSVSQGTTEAPGQRSRQVGMYCTPYIHGRFNVYLEVSMFSGVVNVDTNSRSLYGVYIYIYVCKYIF